MYEIPCNIDHEFEFDLLLNVLNTLDFKSCFSSRSIKSSKLCNVDIGHRVTKVGRELDFLCFGLSALTLDACIICEITVTI